MLKRTLHYLLLASISLAAGCTKEDVETCNPGVQLHYFYSLNSEGVNLFSKEVSKMTVYVFDKDGLFYATYSEEGLDLTADSQVHLPLKAGKYRVISWGGPLRTYNFGEFIQPFNNTFQNGLRNNSESLQNLPAVAVNPPSRSGYMPIKKGVTSINDFRLMIADTSMKEQVVDNLDDLYHGDPTDIEVKADVEVSASIELTKNTNTITMTVTGLDNIFPDGAKAASSTFDVRISSANGSYKVDNSIDNNAKSITYIPSSIAISSNMLTYDLKVLRLVIGNPVRLVVMETRTGKKWFDYDIMELILKNPKYKNQKDIDKDDHYHFECKIQPDLTVTIKVNGWEVINVIPQQ